VAKRGIDVASSFAKVALIFCSGLTHAGVLVVKPPLVEKTTPALG